MTLGAPRPPANSRSRARPCRPLTLVGTTAVALAIAACGGAGNDAGRSSNAPSAATGHKPTAVPTSSTVPEPRRDRDHDRDNPTDSYYDKDDDVLHYGRVATGSVRTTIASLVEHYLAAAAIADGTTACGFLYSLLAEAIPEDYGHAAGAPALHGDTCPVVMSKLFTQNRRILAGYLRSHNIRAVRVKGERGFALLDSGPSNPPTELQLRREGRAWRIHDTLPNILR